MTDVIHICVAMKPLDGNFAQNALEHGVSGINVDGCRVVFVSDEDEKEAKEKQSLERGGFHGEKTGKYGTGEQVGFDRSGKGRWPANVVLSHHPECQQRGTKKVKGSVNHHQSGTSIGGDGVYQGGKKRVGHDYVVDGKETVADWACHPDCPVKKLDEQSFAGGWGETKRNPDFFKDKGGTSRFFKVIQE